MAATRDRLLAATNELFRRRGYHGTSLKQVTEAAGAPTGSLYHFFPGGKEELAEAVIVTSGAVYQQLLEVIASEAAGPADAITDFFEGAALVLEQTDFIDPCPIGTVAREIANTNEPLRLAAAGVFTNWLESAALYLRSYGIADDVANELAITFVTALEGSFVLARTQRDGDILRTTGRAMRRLIEQALADKPVVA